MPLTLGVGQGGCCMCAERGSDMRTIVRRLIVAMLALLAPMNAATAQDQSRTEIDHGAELDRAASLIRDHKPAEADAILSAVIATQEREDAAETNQIYCARTGPEVILYMGMAAADKKTRSLVRSTAPEACFSRRSF